MVINCYHYPLLTVDQSLGMLDENLLGLCPLIPTWLLTVPAASAALGWLHPRLWWLTAGHLSQPTRSASIHQRWPRPAFLIFPTSLVCLQQRLPQMPKSQRGCWGKGTEAHVLATVICAAQPVSLQLRDPRRIEKLFTGGCLRPRVFTFCSVLSISPCASCQGISLQDGQIKTTGWHLVEFI